MRNGKNHSLFLPRKPLPKKPHGLPFDEVLDPDTAALVEQIRNRGTSLNADAGCWTEQAGKRATAYGIVPENGSGNTAHGMRLAEARSRRADRRNSSWFNDDMLTWWYARWAQDDARMVMRAQDCPQAFAQWQRAKLEARQADQEERTVMRREWDAWERQQLWLQEQRQRRAARWTDEERQWFLEEVEAKAAQLKAARAQRERTTTVQHTANRELKSLIRLLRRTAHHVNQRHPRYRRYPQENARTLEIA